MKTIHRHLLTILAAASLAACSSVKLDDAPAGASNTSATGVVGSAGAGGAQSAQTRVAPVDATPTGGAAMGNSARVVYFDYDSYVVRDDFRPVIENNAKMLSSNNGTRVSVQGHTDERGSSEYNLALGQRRAEAVAKSLALFGAQPSQIEAVSFGKERPAVEGHDEDAWAKNRRAEIVAAGR